MVVEVYFVKMSSREVFHTVLNMRYMFLKFEMRNDHTTLSGRLINPRNWAFSSLTLHHAGNIYYN